jgi:hypothetical protein
MTEEVNEEYHTLIGSLRSIADYSRPNIAYAATSFKRILHSSDEFHINAVKGVLSFLYSKKGQIFKD